MIYLGLKSENRMDDDMAEDNIRKAAARRQRIQMLKKCIILTMVTPDIRPDIRLSCMPIYCSIYRKILQGGDPDLPVSIACVLGLDQ